MATQVNGETRFFDSHAHLGDGAFGSDLDAVIQRARATGAEGIVCIGSALDAGDPSRKISADNSGFIWWTSGVHPHEASEFDSDRDIPRIRAAITEGAVAIGECGLDYHHDNSPRETQRAAFEAQIHLASETGKPVVVHTRDAEADTIAMIQMASAEGVRGVLHCFTGSRELAESALAAGWYISFSGIVTFKAWSGDEIVMHVPESRILAESDSPYLAPVPNRGKRNEPSWVAKTVERLAAVRGVPANQMGAQVTRNAMEFFGLTN